MRARGGVRARPAEPAVRLRVERLLDAAALEPEGLPPAAVLVVRSLSDPLPGRIDARRAEVRAPAEWERAVRSALADRWRAAARPVGGVVPEGAAAVLFACQAELLAAFARDAAAGVAAGRWWWRAVLRAPGGGQVAALAALWAREARHVPAAVEHLAAWGEAARVFAALPAEAAARILAAVAHAFELPALLAAPPAPRPASRDADRRPAMDGGADVVSDSSADPISMGDARPPAARPSASPPWELVASASLVPASLGVEQKALLGACLTLHRAPLLARSRAFVERFVRWRAAASSSSAPAAEAREERRPSLSFSSAEPIARAESPARTEDARPAVDPSTQAAARPSADEPRFSGDSSRSIDSERDTGVDRPVAVDAAADEGRRTEMEIGRSTAPDRPSIDVRAGRETVDEAGPVDVHRPSDRPSIDTDTADGRVEPLMAWTGPTVEVAETHSALCGVFFLANAVRALDFFRALDEHFRLSPVVGGWGWIELLARALLGPDAIAHAHDPVWRVLAGLDGRADDVPAGFGFAAPEVESLPDAWARLLADAGRSAPEPSPPLGIDPGPDLRSFLDLVVPFVRLRLEAALRAGGAEDEALGTALFRRSGLVQVTRSHVDVRMALDEVTLPARLAGLDANPGWVPELARVVTFHFA